MKRLGCYLIEAGLITQAQIDVALNDQKIMDDMRFGEVLVARGWIKQQTLDYLIKKIVDPEQRAARASQQKSLSPDLVSAAIVKPTPPSIAAKSSSVLPNERKPLPSLPADDGVSWAG
ncbi:hypothetical protein [Phormidesmis priestleyi]|uniref:hypothetical protein n=1 Tax=Phormidesmis priestleyi TaxID=268141 RepID=UPI000D05DCFA|nr:hypothetical protein [Phormidesmis priestleyi]